jgi:hypothetical protein
MAVLVALGGGMVLAMFDLFKMCYQKVIYKAFFEQLSELRPRFYSGGGKPGRFHPVWPDNTRRDQCWQHFLRLNFWMTDLTTRHPKN